MEQTKKAIQKHIQLFAISSIILFVAITAVILVGNIQKAQAGDRRLLIWNITTQAIMEHPVTGIGIGGFPATYAKEQSAYFETDTASSKEKQTATCPQYAYNEYLQIGLELGITGLLFFIFWLAFSLYYGSDTDRLEHPAEFWHSESSPFIPIRSNSRPTGFCSYS